MLDLLESSYLWLKAAHVVAMVSWMAGLFYLPRIFVYHAERATVGSELDRTFQVMEDKLLRLIMRPALIATWGLGIVLVLLGGWWTEVWLWVKVTSVLALSAFHGWCVVRARDFAEGRNSRTGRTFRIMNEVPTLLLLVIVVMVIVKPF
ncbi:protoporphyrinogen oxidase HemJ [Rubellimicrobium roseum]|uniref:Protoporphyrinogen IX oxidase n=1 Tax=Rubellimicrobium roseum TaxID=687525 RepID=A0A5C4NJL0_9RHOB|nr:protoporphyrinogen oxidase HemJ [Rubellimicrobium roseum]TNC74302.1 protoporphyrinogen oxidase HemJ [Rubellimicrobium roseum]